jgi:hypothetical protein
MQSPQLPEHAPSRTPFLAFYHGERAVDRRPGVFEAEIAGIGILANWRHSL